MSPSDAPTATGLLHSHRLVAHLATRHVKVWYYVYQHLTADDTPLLTANVTSGWATHGAEVAFAFGTKGDAAVNELPFTDEEKRLSDEIIERVVTLATEGFPGSAAGAEWPSVSTPVDSLPTLRFDTASNGGVALAFGYREDACAFWASSIPDII